MRYSFGRLCQGHRLPFTLLSKYQPRSNANVWDSSPLVSRLGRAGIRQTDRPPASRQQLRAARSAKIGRHVPRTRRQSALGPRSGSSGQPQPWSVGRRLALRGLSIDETGPHRQAGDGCDDRWKPAGEIVAVAREQPQAAAVAAGHDAKPIMLDLMQPPWLARRRGGAARQTGLDEMAQRPGSVTHTRRHAAYLAPPSSEAESFDRWPSSSGSLAKMAAMRWASSRVSSSRRRNRRRGSFFRNTCRQGPARWRPSPQSSYPARRHLPALGELGGDLAQ
jgi:hypothetical protein